MLTYGTYYYCSLQIVNLPGNLLILDRIYKQVCEFWIGSHRYV